MSMFNFFHKLRNPHCADCRLERECENCETLHLLLEQERQEKREILRQLLEALTPKPVVATGPPGEEIKPIQRNGPIPWKVKQQLLEEQDRAKARVLHSSGNDSVEKLEAELGIEDKASAT